ncbi:PAS domain-containing protein, partial [Halobium palmae]
MASSVTRDPRRAADTDALYTPPPDAGREERLEDERDFWRHQFEQLVERFPEPALVVDGDGRVTHWNEKQADIAGRAAEDVVGVPAHDAIGTEGVEETLAETLVRTGETIREEQIRSATRDDDETWHVRAAGQPLTD